MAKFSKKTKTGITGIRSGKIMSDIDVLVVGAGPAGSYTAKLLADKGFRVVIAEEHSKIGIPVQCTGLLSQEYCQIPIIANNIEQFVVNTIASTHVFAPDGSFADIPLKGDIVVDRTKFDSFLAGEAVSSGALLLKSHKFIGFDSESSEVLLQQNNLNKKSSDDLLRLKPRIVVAADGPISSVCMAAGFFSKFKPRKFMLGMQQVVCCRAAREKNIKISQDTIDFFPFVRKFAWSVPDGKGNLRIGVVDYLDTSHDLSKEIQRIEGIVGISSSERCNKKNKENTENKKNIQAGLIPVFDPDFIPQKNFAGISVFAVGDAAGHVKATTGGGIIPGMLAAECLVTAISSGKISGKNYTLLLKKSIYKDLKMSLRLRNALDKFSDKDYCALVSLCKNQKVKSAFESVSRDSPMKLFCSLAVAEPRLMKFIKYLF